MDEKYVWPLIGVALGWVLSLVASGLKDRADNKRKVGLLLTKLVIVHDQVITLIAVAEQIKDQADGWEEYERMRKGITNRHFLEPSSHVDSLRSAIDSVSGIYPLEALSLHGLIDTLLKNKKASLIAISKHRETYVRAISAYEAGLELCQTELEKRIRLLAFKHGWLTYAGILKKSWSRARRREKTEAFISKFSGELWAEFKRFSEQEESPNPSTERGNYTNPKAADYVER